jgi:hypothetical protein
VVRKGSKFPANDHTDLVVPLHKLHVAGLVAYRHELISGPPDVTFMYGFTVVQNLCSVINNTKSADSIGCATTLFFG